jgi:hypothetical protein
VWLLIYTPRRENGEREGERRRRGREKRPTQGQPDRNSQRTTVSGSPDTLPPPTPYSIPGIKRRVRREERESRGSTPQPPRSRQQGQEEGGEEEEREERNRREDNKETEKGKNTIE